MKISNLLKSQQHAEWPRLITLTHNQSFRIPQSVDELEVFSGCAWITVAGQDIIVTNKQIVSIPQSKNGVIISSVTHEPLVFELRTKAINLT